MPGVKLFVVVEFLQESNVDIVHQTWLLKTTGSDGFVTTQAFWPPSHLDSARLVKAGTPPDEELWTLYPVRIMGSCDDYLLARKKCKKAEDTSNLETDNDSQSGKRRNRKRPQCDSSCEEEEEIANTQQVKSRKGSAPALKQAPRPPPAPLSRSGTPSSQKPTPSSPDTMPSLRQQQPDGSAPADEVLERHVLRVLAQHTRLLTNLEKGQKELLQSVNLLLGKNDEAIPTVPGDMELPLATLDDMAQMEDKLSDKAVENTLIRNLAFGGSSSHQLVKRIMKELMKDELAVLYNWKGQKGTKRAFCGTKLQLVVNKAVQRNPGTATVSTFEIENRIKDHLKFAWERLGGRKQRLDMKKSETVAPSEAGSSN